MSKVKKDRIKQWRLENAERIKDLEELEKQTEAVKASKTILNHQEWIIKKKKKKYWEKEMEQEELRHRKMKINLSIN